MDKLLMTMRARFESLHKTKSNFGTLLEKETRADRTLERSIIRKNIRESTLLQRRNIVEEVQPATTVASNKKNAKTDRRARLEQWRREKENRTNQEKTAKKPVFKVGARNNIGFGISDTFQPPKNIQPLPMKKPQNLEICTKTTGALRKTERIGVVTRSKKPIASPPLPLPVMNRRIKKTTATATSEVTNNEKAPLLRQNAVHEESDIIEPQPTDDQCIIPLTSSSNPKTMNPNINAKNYVSPDKKPEPVYVSPYVTVTRGKRNLKKENNARAMLGLPEYNKHSTPLKEVNDKYQTVGAVYFENILEDEVSKIVEKCNTWTSHKEQTVDLTEEAEDMINVAIGQANLLMTKKFEHFRSLVNACKNNECVEGDHRVTCEDLQGFWDMIYMQVDNVNMRFQRLIELRNNNWLEIKPAVKRQVPKKKTNTVKFNQGPSSNLRAAIQAAREKAKSQKELPKQEQEQKQENENTFDGGFFIVRTPQKQQSNTSVSEIGTPKRSILKSSAYL